MVPANNRNVVGSMRTRWQFANIESIPVQLTLNESFFKLEFLPNQNNFIK